MNKAAIIIETRPLENIREIIENHTRFLDDSWRIIVYHGYQNGFYFLKQLYGIERLDFALLDYDEMDFRAYNNLLAMEGFWETIQADKVLVFQHDSRLLRTGIEEFLEWDYVGAPWKFQQHGGNGGLSLRTTKVMMEIARNHKYTADRNEDIYFCEYVNKYGKLAPRDVCSKFSCESIYKLGTLGVHAIEQHLTEEEVGKIYNQYQ